MSFVYVRNILTHLYKNYEEILTLKTQCITELRPLRQVLDGVTKDFTDVVTVRVVVASVQD